MNPDNYLFGVLLISCFRDRSFISTFDRGKPRLVLAFEIKDMTFTIDCPLLGANEGSVP